MSVAGRAASKVDDFMHGGAIPDGPTGVKNSWCNMCWEVLPDNCCCGALRFCRDCADGSGDGSLASDAGGGVARVSESMVGIAGVMEALRYQSRNVLQMFSVVDGLMRNDVVEVVWVLQDVRFLWRRFREFDGVQADVGKDEIGDESHTNGSQYRG